MMKFNIPFIKHTKTLVSLAVLFTGAGIWLTATKGLNYGTDFLGGYQLQYQFAQPVDEQKIRDALRPLGLPDLSIQRVGSPEEKSVSLKFAMIGTPEEKNPTPKITEALKSLFGTDQVSLRQEEVVGPKVGAELRRNAIKAVIISFVLILIYVAFRFDFNFSPATIICLFHDVFVTLGAIALTGREFNLTILAAILTIVGYSVNDTIVIFDRVRENIPRYPTLDRATVVNNSLNETLGRTIITNVTVFLAVASLYLFGGGVIHDFAFTMLVGTIAGTFSTLSVACPFYLMMVRLRGDSEGGFGKK